MEKMEKTGLLGINMSGNLRKPEPFRCTHCSSMIEPTQHGRFWARGACDCEGAVEERVRKDEEIRQTAEREERDRRVAWLRDRKIRAGLDGGYTQMIFDTFDSTVQPEAYQAAMDFEGDRSLVLHSKGFGTGKTHLAAAILHRHIDQGNRGYFLHVPTFLARIRRTFEPGAGEHQYDLMREMQEAGLLVLDDLGKAKQSEWKELTLYTLIDYRSVHGLPLVITTNLDKKRLLTQIGPASVSRLLGMADFVEVEGEDYRLRGRGR